MKTLIVLLALVLTAETGSAFNESLIKVYNSPHTILESKNLIEGRNDRALFFATNASTYGTSFNYLRFDVKNNSVVSPYRGMIGTLCVYTFFPPYLACDGLGYFAISRYDTSFVYTYRVSPGAECPDANAFRTYDAGVTVLYSGFNCGGMIFYPVGLDIDPVNDSIVYFAYPNIWTGNNENMLFKSTDRGNEFQQLSILPPGVRNESYFYNQQPNSILKIVPFQRNNILINGDSAVFLSTNSGSTFSELQLPNITNFLFNEQDEIIFAYKGNFLYKSTDAGITWTNAINDFTFNTLEVSPDNSNIMYAGSPSGLHRSTDGGDSWALYNNTFFPSKNVLGIAKFPGMGDTVAAITNDGIYRVWADRLTDIITTGISSPDRFTLMQNYPNPFNPTTTIRFDLPNSSDVKLTVHDALGRTISTLVNDRLNAGSYNYQFTSDDFHLTSGVYFYSIKAGDFHQTKRMILLK